MKKPVLVYIYTNDMAVPTYADLVLIKQESEAHGQPFILLPEPESDSQGRLIPSIPLSNFQISDVDQALQSYFGENGEFHNQEFTTVINAHGDVEGAHWDKRIPTELIEATSTSQKGEHIFQFGTSPASAQNFIEAGMKLLGQEATRDELYQQVSKIGESRDSTELFDILLQFKDKNGHLCTSIIDASCYGGASVVDLTESLVKQGGVKDRDVHFFSLSSFYELGFQNDITAFTKTIPELALKEAPLNAQTLKEAYLRVAGSTIEAIDRSSIEKIFNSEELLDANHVPYENFEAKIEFLIDHFSDIKQLDFSNQLHKEFIAVLEEYNKENQLSAAFLKQHLAPYKFGSKFEMSYPKLLFIADEIFDQLPKDYGISKNNDSLSDVLLNVYSGQYSALNDISSDQRVTLLCKLSKDGDVLLDSFKEWEDLISIEERQEILLKVAENSPESLFRFPIWCQTLSEHQQKEITSKAIQELSVTNALFVLHGHSWKNGLSAKEVLQYKEEATRNDAKFNPKYVFESANVQFINNVPIDEIITIESLTISERMPHLIPELFKKWKDSYSIETEKELISRYIPSLFEFAKHEERFLKEDIEESINTLKLNVSNDGIISLIDGLHQKETLKLEVENAAIKGLGEVHEEILPSNSTLKPTNSENIKTPEISEGTKTKIKF